MSIITTGFDDLDSLIGGFHTGDLVVVGSLPGVGKSTLAQNVATHAALTLGVPSLIMTFEDGVHNINMDLMGALASVDVSNIRNGTMTDGEMRKVRHAGTVLDDAPIYVSDRSPADWMTFMFELRAAVAHMDIGVIVVDPIQRCAEHKDDAQVDEVCRDLKKLAVDTDTVVIAVSHLDRVGMVAPDQPRVEDVQSAAGIVPHADVVVLLDRPDFHDEDSGRVGEADLIVGKNRHGATGVATVAHQFQFSRFVPMRAGRNVFSLLA